MKKQLPPFIFHLPNNLQLEINAKVDTRTEQEIYDEALNKIVPYNSHCVVAKESQTGKISDIHFHAGSIISGMVKDEVAEILQGLPIKVYYLPNNENIYIEYDKKKSVEIQTIFYEQFNVKELLLNCSELIQKINNQAIAESQKPETICQ